MKLKIFVIFLCFFLLNSFVITLEYFYVKENVVTSYKSVAKNLADIISYPLKIYNDKEVIKVTSSFSRLLPSGAILIERVNETDPIEIVNLNYKTSSCNVKQNLVPVKYNGILIGNLKYCYNHSVVWYKSINWLVIFTLNFMGVIVLHLFYKLNKEERSNIARLSFISQQVAHDIKSPLAALEIVMDDLKSLPEDTREITINAVNRIKGIANDLSKQKEKSLSSGHVNSRILISITLMNIVNEKIVENQNKQNVEIILNDESERDSFINIEEEVFLRIVSNLINNSIEAMEKNIQVRVNLSEMNGIVTLSVEDNGRGFPETFLDEGIERGKSIQKVGGQGLGLWYAKDEVEKCGGEFLISNTDNGAKVEIKLKVVEAPKWFQGTINLKNMKNVVIVDDDLSIHDLWKKKLKGMSLNIKNFHSAEEFEAGLEDQKETLYLLDFDLRNSLTGVDLIVKYKLKNSLLVTSNYDVPEVIGSCEQNNISILPKQLVPFISAYS